MNFQKNVYQTMSYGVIIRKKLTQSREMLQQTHYVTQSVYVTEVTNGMNISQLERIQLH